VSPGQRVGIYCGVAHEPVIAHFLKHPKDLSRALADVEKLRKELK